MRKKLRDAASNGGNGRACGNDHVSLSDKDLESQHVLREGQSSSLASWCAKELLPGVGCPWMGAPSMMGTGKKGNTHVCKIGELVIVKPLSNPAYNNDFI
eukprot:1533583-Ditylum_brightwellii.AAC.1